MLLSRVPVSDKENGERFDLTAEYTQADSQPAGETPVEVSPENASPIVPASLEDTSRATVAAGLASYHWIVATDEIFWSPNAAEVLLCPIERLKTGKRFATFLDPENLTTRYEAVVQSRSRDNGSGVGFNIEYRFRPEGRNAERSIWLEDQGKWLAGRDGRPAEVYGVVSRIDERHQRDQQLGALGGRDPLTGMMNAGRMAEALSETIASARHDGARCAFALASVNNLPLVNQAYGYEISDEVISAIGNRLRQTLRNGDAIARYSGSKFGIILNSCPPSDLPQALERYLAVVRDSVIETSKGPVWAMLAIGGISLPDHAQDAQTAIARSEQALNAARQMTTDGAQVYVPSEARDNEQLINARCAAEIVQCLKSDSFKLAFQPIRDAKTGEIAHYETLLRMIDESGEVITAGHLIPVAEHLGLVRLIDRAVVQMAVATLHSFPDAKIAMNVSATTAMDPRWSRTILDIIGANRSIAQRLTVEITETVALSNIETTKAFVTELRSIGCGIAIDDFGAGYTSFRNVRDLPVTTIKLDGSFCHDLTNNKDNEYFVRSLIDLAHTFNLKVVAEWVESAEDAKLLTQWGADYLQGNYVGAASITVPWSAKADAGFNLDGETIADAAAEVPTVHSDAVQEAASEPVPKSEAETALTFDEESDAEIAKLRGTLSLLDQYFRKPAPEQPAAEPEEIQAA